MIKLSENETNLGIQNIWKIFAVGACFVRSTVVCVYGDKLCVYIVLHMSLQDMNMFVLV